MQFLLEALVHTPWWVFVLFFYFLKVSLDALKPRVLEFKKLFILPAIFLGLTVQSVFFKGTLSWFTGITFALFLISGGFLGWNLVKSSQIKVDPIKDLVQVPGSSMTLILFLTIFASKYYIGYTEVVHPEAMTHLSFMGFQTAVYGISTGLLLGRLIKYFVIKPSAPHEELKKSS